MRIPRFLGWLILAMIVSSGALQAAGDPAWVWWEGESPIATNYPSTSPFAASTFPNNRDLLSGGDWLTSDGQRREGVPPLFARYAVAVPQSGAYHLWSRKFWQHGPFRWRFDDRPWAYVGRDIALADSTEIRTHLVANWVYLGQVQLDAGRRRFEFELTAKPGEPLVSAFDAFLLISGPFMPRGRLKPGEQFGQADPGFFPYEPSLDPFTPDGLLDLRSLNEAAAGEHGFVRYRGSQFLLGGGAPVRFWGVNISSNNVGQDRASVDYLARRLAKSGVNIVRFHSPLFDQGGNDPSRINPKALDNLFYAVAAFKREGIYTSLSFYFPLWFSVRPEYGIPGYETIGNKHPFTLLYFDERLQAIYKAWLDTILTTPNPYTGQALGAEPAIAMIELINEDSFFFWTFAKGNIPAAHWQRLEGLFGQWLADRYGALRAAFDAWGGAPHADDHLEEGRAGLYEAWFMTSDGIKQVNRRRIGDQVRFLTELQRSFYEATARYIEEDLGSQSLIVPSNWTVADPMMLDALERYTYTAGDVIDRHGYVQGKHEGDGAGWSVRAGHTYEDLAAVPSLKGCP